ncbi:hypothetical protein [Microbacterium sp. NPDC087665]|uniref:hypothetical protein n=1 Tax=Microbacterium sp. NPDC087665 TaxID=3364194 RepID=UPI00382EF586
MVTEHPESEERRLRARLSELERQRSELWRLGMSLGGSAVVHLQQTQIDDEERAIRARLDELAP